MDIATIFIGSAYVKLTGVGAWGAVVRRKEENTHFRGRVENVLPNRVELIATIKAFESLSYPHDVRLYSTMSYLLNGMNSHMGRWKRNNWRTKDDRPIENADLWQYLDKLTRPHKVLFRRLKPHKKPNAIKEVCGLVELGLQSELVAELSEDANPLDRLFFNTMHE